MDGSFASIVGGASGGVLLVMIATGLIWFYLRRKMFSNKNSETASSDPSTQVEWNMGEGSTSVAGSRISGTPRARQFTLEELEQATNQFNESNLIGSGSFGLVYKGLLRDGTFVALKRRLGSARQEFVQEVCYLSEIQHRNIVSLLGYCQENGNQMLVFEYLPNKSVCGHLYDNGQDPTTKLEFKQRLSIALGAAKGLCHLHSMIPPAVHKNFKTANVLVDENFIPKVSDAGILRLLERIEDVGPSSRTTSDNVFRDPEVGVSKVISEANDIYSFGVFLLELLSGQDISRISLLEPGKKLTQWVESRLRSNELVDSRLTSSFTYEGMKDLIRLTLECLNITGKGRLKMDIVVSALDRILEKEMAQTTAMGASSAIFTPGSELFTSL